MLELMLQDFFGYLVGVLSLVLRSALFAGLAVGSMSLYYFGIKPWVKNMRRGIKLDIYFRWSGNICSLKEKKS